MDTVQRNREFSGKLKLLIEQHSGVVDSLAAGLRECLQKPGMGEQLHLDSFLDGMLRSRITRRVMAEQHTGLQQQRPGYVGAVATDLDLKKSLEFAAMRAQKISKETYGTAPDCDFSAEVRLKVAYLPTHLDYMLFKLMRNAMRATVERAQANGGRMSPIRVRGCEGDAVTIRIADWGEAFRMRRWTASGSTASPPRPSLSRRAPRTASRTSPGGQRPDGAAAWQASASASR